MPEDKYKILKVTIEHHYMIPMHSDEQTRINGWSMKQVIHDWFRWGGEFLTTYHASREGHEIGGARKFIKAEVVDEIER